MDDLTKDKRFSHIVKDPRFRHMSKKDHKVKIDQRFKGMFKDKNFKLKYTVDKRGRPVNTTTNENLRRFYDLSGSDESDEDDDKISLKKQQKKKEKKQKDSKEQKHDTKKPSEKKSRNDGETGQQKHSQNKKEKKNTVSPVVKLKNSSDKSKMKQTSEMGKSKMKEMKLTTEKKMQDESSDEDEGVALATDTSDDEKAMANIEGKGKAAKNIEDKEQGGDDEDESDDDDDDEQDDDESEDTDEESSQGVGAGPDLARGEGLVESSTDEVEDDTDIEEEEDVWDELTKDTIEVEEATHRLAVCNMDWDRIKAQDLYVLLNSFKPVGGVIYSVKIYPSEFGKQRMLEEEKKGPTELVERALSSDEEDENQEGSKFQQEKLRKYQMNRLKYYYAVVECDSAGTANHIYGECDGLEYESSSTKLDLRFIPDDTRFDDTPSSIASEIPDTTTYKPSLFVTTALNQSKVECTWDETNKDRVAMTMRKFKKDDLEELDFKAYLASSDSEDDGDDDPYGSLLAKPDFVTVSSSEDSDEEKAIEKYKSLLKGADENKVKDENEMEMEITWEPGLKETTKELVEEKSKGNEKLTPWEEFLKKKKEKRKMKKEKSKNDDDGSDSDKDDDKAFSDDDLPSDVDVNGFENEIQEGKVKKGKNKKNKKKQSKSNNDDDQDDVEKKREEAEMSLLLMDSDDEKQHFSLQNIMDQEKKKKKKKLKKKKDPSQVVEDNFQMNYSDPRFASIYSSHHFNVDPSAPEYKKTKGMEGIVEEKLKRRTATELTKSTSKTKKSSSSEPEAPANKMAKMDQHETEKLDKDVSLSSLVKSVKAKTQQFQKRKKK